MRAVYREWLDRARVASILLTLLVFLSSVFLGEEIAATALKRVSVLRGMEIQSCNGAKDGLAEAARRRHVDSALRDSFCGC
jgi:hypothetical protein